MRLAMKTLNRAILGALLSGFVFCNFGAQANVPYSKHGEWSVAYLEVGNLNGCRATRQFPDQTVFQMDFAIQPSFVMNFLSVKGTPPKYSPSTGTRSLPHEVCDIAKKFTIQIYCQGSPKTTESAGPLALSPSDIADFGTRP
jgi:hypothetical protein